MILIQLHRKKHQNDQLFNGLYFYICIVNTTINSGRHDILLTNDIGNQMLRFLSETSFSKIFVIADHNTSRYCLPLVSKFLPADFQLIRIEPDELNKNLQSCTLVWKQLLEHGADRHSLIINLGGGMVSDLGGFAAATFKRGIRFINIPTSLLGMVDASSGGKTGIDLEHYKNMVGVFAFPELVVIDPGFLQTLPEKEWRNGIAELIKHALIAEGNLWGFLNKEITGDIVSINAELKTKIISLIEETVGVKVAIVARDPFENNERMFLNFGHTIGHALETCSMNHDVAQLSHGEAVAAGMICESFISMHHGGLSKREMNEIARMIIHFFPVRKIATGIFEELYSLMKSDKKSQAGEINFALLQKIHLPVIRNGINQELINRSFEYYNSLL